MTPFMSGCYSLSDERMFAMLAELVDTENIHLEPSALAGMYGPVLLAKGPSMREYAEKEQLEQVLAGSTQLVWATGGNVVPEDEQEKYYQKGEEERKSARKNQLDHANSSKTR